MDDSNVGMDVVKGHEHLSSPLLYHGKRNCLLVGERLTEDGINTRSRNRCDKHGMVSMFAFNAELVDKMWTVVASRMVRVCVLDTAKN
jgi:hypothetical protein